MAWSDTLQQASFKGVSFDVESIGDAGARAIAPHEYPFTNGADVEDLGNHPDQISVTAIVWGDGYEDRLTDLRTALRSAGAGVLVHPVFGTIAQAICRSWQIVHDADRRDQARVYIEFIESTATARIFTESSPLQAADEVIARGSDVRAAVDGALVERTERVAQGPVADALTLRDFMRNAIAQLRVLTDTTGLKALLSDLDPLLFPRAYVNDAKAVLDIALQGLPFGGRNILFEGTSIKGTGRDDFDRAAEALGPEALPVSTTDTNGRLVQAHARAHGACSLAEAAMIVLVAELDEALLDRADIEAIANTTRTAIQAAIEGLRSAAPGGPSAEACAALRALAFRVLQAATAVIEQRPPVITRVVPLSGPLRLVAHALYGDHTRAPELARLNSFGRKVVLEAGQEIKAYAR